MAFTNTVTESLVRIWRDMTLHLMKIIDVSDYLLRRNIVSWCPHINLLIDIKTRNHKEDPRTPSSSLHQSAQPEDDGPLVLLDHLHDEEEREWHCGDDEEDRDNCQEVGEHAGTLLTNWNRNILTSQSQEGEDWPSGDLVGLGTCILVKVCLSFGWGVLPLLLILRLKVGLSW